MNEELETCRGSWTGVRGHERAKPYDPAATKRLNNTIEAQKEAARRAVAEREAKRRAEKTS